MRLRKSASFTRWDTRPLSDEQVGYAREDVLHLLQLADALQSTLRDRGRLDWALEECRSLEDASDEREPETIFHRLPRVNSLEPSQRAVAFELVRWREETARETDRPVPSVLADAALVEVAKRRPASLERLAQIRGLNESTLRRRGRAIIEVVERGRERDPIPVDGDRPAPTDAKDAPLIALGEALVRARASEAELAYELHRGARRPAADRHAVRTSGDEPEVRTLQGWRRRGRSDGRRSLLRARCAARGPAHLRIDAARRRLRCGENVKNAVDPVAQAATKTVNSGSVEVAMSGKVSAAGQEVPLTARACSTSRPSAAATMTTSVPGQGDVRVEEIMDGLVLYMLSDALTGAARRQEVAEDRPRGGRRKQGVDVAQLQSLSGGGDPTQFLTYLAKAGDVRKVGSEDVNGTPTTHYHATIDFDKLAGSAGKAAASVRQLHRSAAGSAADRRLDRRRQRVRRQTVAIDVKQPLPINVLAADRLQALRGAGRRPGPAGRRTADYSAVAGGG